jgi:hypothetical protein
LRKLIQQDEDKEDPNERRDADSDVEMNDVKPSEDSARYFLLFVHSVIHTIIVETDPCTSYVLPLTCAIIGGGASSV